MALAQQTTGPRAIGTGVIGSLAGLPLAGLVLAAPALGQSLIVPDSTLGGESSGVIQNFNGFPVELIVDGAVRDRNLFHSFSEFNIDLGRGAYFLVPNPGIANIFARVTGTNASDISGILGTFLPGSAAAANLFLINPNGIVFGEGAQLDIGGSFTATTADAVAFGALGEFSADSPGLPSALLTVDPSAYLFQSENPADISSRSTALDPFVNLFPGLWVPIGENLTLLGGNISIDGGNQFAGLRALGGRIDLGSVAGPGQVAINGDGSLSFAEALPRGDIAFTNTALADVTLEEGGSIGVTAGNISLSDRSSLRAGIRSNFGFVGAQAGDITVEATGTLQVLSDSFIENDVNRDASGNSGNVLITAGSVIAGDGVDIGSVTAGFGNAGNLVIRTRDRISLGAGSILLAQVPTRGRGNAGDIILETGVLELLGGQISTGVFGQGEGGDIVVTARDRIVLEGPRTSGSPPAGIFSSLEDGASGQGGDVFLTTGDLQIRGYALIDAGTRGEGSGGNIRVDAQDITVDTDGASDLSGIFTGLGGNGFGTGGDIAITTQGLRLLNGGQIYSGITGAGFGGRLSIIVGFGGDTIAEGRSGNIRIDARDITIDGDGTFAPSGIYASVGQSGFGFGGDIDITTNSLSLTQDGVIFSGVLGAGFGGDIRIRAEDITVVGTGSAFSTTGITANLSARLTLRNSDNTIVIPLGIGEAGSIEIETGSLRLLNDAEVSARTDGQGDAGDLTIRADRIVMNNSSNLLTASTTDGNAGNILVETGTLLMLSGAQISAFSEGEGSAGSITVRARDTIELSGFNPEEGTPTALFTDNEDESIGPGGAISITANRLRVGPGAIIDTSTRNGERGGDLTVNAAVVEAVDGGQLITIGLGSGPAGTIAVTATDRIRIDGFDPTFEARRDQFGLRRIGVVDASSGFFARAEAGGPAGDIRLQAPIIELDNTGQVSAESFSGNGGNILVQNADLLLLRRGSTISTSAGTIQAGGNGGNITVNMPQGFVIAVPEENSDITANAFTGQGGQVAIATQGLFGLQFRSQSTPLSDITASSQFGLSGEFSLTSPDTSGLENGLTELPDGLVNPEQLLAGSCLARSNGDGSFVVTGGEGLPQRPGDTQSTFSTAQSPQEAAWQPGDPVVEPQAVYALENGRLMLSRECS